MERERLAVLLSAHNRRGETVACVEAIRSQSLDADMEVHVILVDDGSTDGTAAAIRALFPDVELIAGTGHLYWNGGMRVAFERAMRGDYDFYLLVNDDTHLRPLAVATMLDTYREVAGKDRSESVVVGSTQDPRTGALSYGGWRTTRKWHRAHCVRVDPCDRPQPCDTLNANCVLIPRAVAKRVGNLDAVFTHSMGDWDYGFRAKRARCALWVAPGFVGTCAANSLPRPWMESRLGVGERWRQLIGPKGLPPAEWLVFTYRHSGALWPLYWINPYVRFWLGAAASVLRRKRKPDADRPGVV